MPKTLKYLSNRHDAAIHPLFQLRLQERSVQGGARQCAMEGQDREGLGDSAPVTTRALSRATPRVLGQLRHCMSFPFGPDFPHIVYLSGPLGISLGQAVPKLQTSPYPLRPAHSAPSSHTAKPVRPRTEFNEWPQTMKDRDKRQGRQETTPSRSSG